MSRIVAIGEEHKVLPFGMVGVEVLALTEPQGAQSAWASLGDDVGLVVLTRLAAEALGPILHEPGQPLWTVMP